MAGLLDYFSFICVNYSIFFYHVILLIVASCLFLVFPSMLGIIGAPDTLASVVLCHCPLGGALTFLV